MHLGCDENLFGLAVGVPRRHQRALCGLDYGEYAAKLWSAIRSTMTFGSSATYWHSSERRTHNPALVTIGQRLPVGHTIHGNG
jgi:hypothetical protein